MHAHSLGPARRRWRRWRGPARQAIAKSGRGYADRAAMDRATSPSNPRETLRKVYVVLDGQA
jgi:hypothetical protein